ncbi:hypothetical protein HK096_003499, partial [Nowakowskiella sp. JEL0078]
MVRQDNFSFPLANQAAVTISQSQYDKRALACNDSLALASSLANLCYMTTFSPVKIAFILENDGGLELLVSIIRKYHFATDYLSRFCFSAALTCVSNIAVRGNMRLRLRLMDADIVPEVILLLQRVVKMLEIINLGASPTSVPLTINQSTLFEFDTNEIQTEYALFGMEIDPEDFEEMQSPENTPRSMELTLENQHTESDMEAAASLTVLAMNHADQPSNNYSSQFLLSPFPNTETDPRQYLTRAPSSSSANTNFSDLGGSELSTGSNATTATEGPTNNAWPQPMFNQPINTEYFRTNTTTPQVYIHPPEDQFAGGPMQQDATRFLGQATEFFQPAPPQLENTPTIESQPQSHNTPAFRTEDILMAIKLVAYLSKYPALRAALHGAFSINVFLLVELFTVPSTLTEIRRWAVICMRNAFKRDSVENANDSVVP